MLGGRTAKISALFLLVTMFIMSSIIRFIIYNGCLGAI